MEPPIGEVAWEQLVVCSARDAALGQTRVVGCQKRLRLRIETEQSTVRTPRSGASDNRCSVPLDIDAIHVANPREDRAESWLFYTILLGRYRGGGETHSIAVDGPRGGSHAHRYAGHRARAARRRLPWSTATVHRMINAIIYCILRPSGSSSANEPPCQHTLVKCVNIW